jgi:outer membrane murein-binding lipoprotein Lpp
MATVLLAVALLAGCGGSGNSAQFNKDFKPINDELLNLGAAVGQAVSGAAKTPDTVLAGEFLGFASRLKGIKARLDALKPPDKLKSQEQRLSAALGRLTADLEAIAVAAQNHKPADARAGAVALVRDSRAEGAARREIARKTGAKVSP